MLAKGLISPLSISCIRYLGIIPRCNYTIQPILARRLLMQVKFSQDTEE